MKVRPPAVSIALFLVLVACADAPLDPVDGGGIDHGTAPDDLLVRIAFEGGFTPIEWTYTNLPTFSLYGDGTITQPGAQIELYPGPALPAISSRRVDEAGIQAILEEALAATADISVDLNDLGSIGVADAHTTVITVVADGEHRTIRAYALSELTDRPAGMPQEEYLARLRLQDLITKLGTLDTWLPDGSLGPETGYEAGAARLFVGRYRPVEDLGQQAMPWPLDAPLSSFGEPTDVGGFRCGVVDGADWTSVHDSASRSNELTPWTDGGASYSILFRPLLPDESGC